MNLRTCKQCGGQKPLNAYHKNGSGRHRAVCKICVRKTADLTAEKARAIAMWHDGRPMAEISRALARNHRTISYWLNAAGIQTGERSRSGLNGTHRGDPAAGEPIGEAGDKFAEIDAAILRARLQAGMVDGRARPSANPWPTKSSLA